MIKLSAAATEKNRLLSTTILQIYKMGVKAHSSALLWVG